MEKSNYSLLQHNTFGLDVETKRFIEYQSVTELKQILADIDFTTTKYLHIGEGSNLLFINNFEGIIFHSAIRGIERIKEDDESVWLKAGAGVIWDDFVEFCVSNNLSGAENLSLIPGE